MQHYVGLHGERTRRSQVLNRWPIERTCLMSVSSCLYELYLSTVCFLVVKDRAGKSIQNAVVRAREWEAGITKFRKLMTGLDRDGDGEVHLMTLSSHLSLSHLSNLSRSPLSLLPTC